MFEVSDEEDQAFWEALPFERLETGIGVESPSMAQKKTYSLNNQGHVTSNSQQNTPVTRKHSVISFTHIPGITHKNLPKERQNSMNIQLDRATDKNQQNTPVMKEEVSRRKGMKRKFPGPAGNLPPDMTKEVSSPEIVPQPMYGGTFEILNNKEEEDPVVSQTSVEGVFSSRPWKKLLADLGPDAPSVLAKFNIKSMLIKANKRTLPRSKIPLILGYIERLDFHGSDGSIVLRDPSGKMNGSIHQELLKDPSTALQVGWVLVLRQVSVISPMRNHYLNITSGNIVAIYHLNKVNEVIMTTGPCNGPSSLRQKQQGNSTSPSLSWDTLIKESEKELKAVPVQSMTVVPKACNSTPAVFQRQSIGAPHTTGPRLAGHEQTIPSPLFAASTSNQKMYNFSPHVSHTSCNNNVGIDFQRTGVNDEFGDDFSDDDSDMLSFCDMNMNTFDKQHESVSKGLQENLCSNNPMGQRIPIPVSDVLSQLSSPTEGTLPENLKYVSRTFSSSSVIPSAHSTPSSLPNPAVRNKRSFSFKVTPNISSPNLQPQAVGRQESRGFLEPQQDNQTPPLPVLEKNVNVRTPIVRDTRVQLGASTSCSKENKSEVHRNNMFGQWNDDLSDELLSQLSEEF